jgi:hypothetical protein
MGNRNDSKLFFDSNFLDSPPPGHYRLVSDFDIGNSKKLMGMTKSHLYSFGASHKVYKKVYNPENPITMDTEQLPGPGHYNNRLKTIGTEGRNYKF